MLACIMAMREAITVPPGCRERYVDLGHRTTVAWRELGLVLCGVSDLVRGYRVAIAKQQQLMLIATVGGRGWAIEGGHRHGLAPGTLLINPPGEAVAWGIAGSRWSMVWWYMRPEPSWSQLLAGGTRLIAWEHGRLLYEAQDALVARAVAASPLAQGCAEVVLSHLRELGRVETGVADPLGRLWAEIESRLHEPWPVAELARRLGCSAPTLQRALRRRFGASANQLLRGMRMRRAFELLSSGDHPLRVIADLVGYSDAFALSNAMRKHFGRSPQALRSQGR